MPQKSKDRATFLINLTYGLVIAAIVVIFFKYLVRLILPFIIAFIMVTLINPMIRKISVKRPQQRKAVSILLMVLLYVVILAILFFLVVGLIVGIDKFVGYFSQSYYSDVLKPSVLSIWENASDFMNQLPDEWVETIANIQTSLLQQAQSLIGTISQKLLSWVTAFSTSIPGFIIALVFTIMLSFFMTVQYEEMLTFFRNQLSDKMINVAKELRSILGQTVAQYVGALLTLMLITAIELSIGLTILGVKNSVLIAIGIAIFDALPVFGTGTIVIPWALLQLIQGDYKMAIGLAIIYAVITFVRNIIEPKIVGDRLGINPIVSIVSIYFGFKVFGVLGMILMPMVAQILLELDKRGAIHIFNWNLKEPEDLENSDGPDDSDNNENPPENQEIPMNTSSTE